MRKKILNRIFLFILLGQVSLIPSTLGGESSKSEKKDQGNVHCTMDFQLKTWSVFYKSGKGEGTITCNNGQKAKVKIRMKGGGFTFGKHNIANGEGRFTPVHDIKELYGKYGSVGGEGGAAKSRIGYSMSKDDITLSIKGTGTGGGFGFDFSSFRVSPAK